MVEITLYRKEARQDWDLFVNQSKNGTFLHLRGYMDYHSDRFADYSLMAWQNGKTMALLPPSRQGSVVSSHAGLTYGAWLMPLKHFDATLMLQVMDAALSFLRRNGVHTLIYKAVPHIYHTYPAEEDLYALFRHNATVEAAGISTTIQLSNPLPFDRGNKSSVNIAVREGVSVGASSDIEGYWHILDDVLQSRYGTHPVHSIEELKLLQSRLPDNIKLYTATLNGNMVAGVLMYYTATVAHSQYIAASPQGRQVKALPLLFQHLIATAKADGFKYFDFGISTEKSGTYLNEGLLQQKSRLGGRGVIYPIFKLEF